MIWKPKKKERKPVKYEDYYGWWFAWYPVEITESTGYWLNGHKVWFKWVLCKKELKFYETTNMFGAPTYDFYTTWKVKLPKNEDERLRKIIMKDMTNG